MKQIATYLLILFSMVSFSQEKDKEQILALKKANNYVYEGNELASDDDFISAEMAYRKAISKQPTSVAGTYNLGNSYYEEGNLEEALYRHQQAAKTATDRSEKHKAFHNIGNILMQNKKCKEAVEAYKNALRNDPTDDESRYNLGLAKICAEQQKDQQDDKKDDENKDKQEDNKENQDKKDQEGDDKEDKKDQGDEDEKEADDKKDEEGKPKDEKEDNGKGDEEKKEDNQKPQPQSGQLSPQQIKNLLEAMNNQEQKVQEKMNAEKQKGVKVKTEKDW